MEIASIKNYSRLVLGTAQLGAPYGIANKQGQPDLDTAKAIVETAWENGIRELDTAQGYGTSETVLGNILHSRNLKDSVKIISKIHPQKDHLDPKVLEAELKDSLKRLQVSKLYALMLHREETLDLWDKGLGKILLNFVEQGWVQKIGVSVYHPTKALQALKTEGISLIQVPANIWDRRFLDAGVFDIAESLEKTIYIRSVFLQGLLMMSLKECSLVLAKPLLEKLDSLCLELGLTRSEITLGYIKEKFKKAKVIVGVESVVQIQNNINDWNKNFQSLPLEKVEKLFSFVNPKILNPSLWQ